MRLALLCILLAPVLCAMDAQGVRFARRTLLEESARKHLRAEVGDIAALSGCQVLAGDFDGDSKPEHAALVWHDRAYVLGLFKDTRESPLCQKLWTQEGSPTAATLALPGRDCICLATTTSADADGGAIETAQWLILRWHNGSWRDALSMVQSQTKTSGRGRLSRVVKREIAVADGKMQLVETCRETLDGKLLEGSETKQTTPITVADDGTFSAGQAQGGAVPVATRAQIARTLEREGLLAAALEHVEVAIAQAETEGVRANDARLLDARSLQLRLQARLPGPALDRK